VPNRLAADQISNLADRKGLAPPPGDYPEGYRDPHGGARAGTCERAGLHGAAAEHREKL